MPSFKLYNTRPGVQSWKVLELYNIPHICHLLNSAAPFFHRYTGTFLLTLYI